MEMTVAAKSVHSVVYDPESKQLDPQVGAQVASAPLLTAARRAAPHQRRAPASKRPPFPCSAAPCLQGDDNLRNSYSSCMQQLLAEQGARPVVDILDVGAATGLSSLALLRAFPDAEVTGGWRCCCCCCRQPGASTGDCARLLALPLLLTGTCFSLRGGPLRCCRHRPEPLHARGGQPHAAPAAAAAAAAAAARQSGYASGTAQRKIPSCRRRALTLSASCW